jgi:zinc transport system permease protein
MMMGKGFKKTVIISISLSVTAVVGGTIASYYLNLAPSGTIVMVLVGMFLSTLLAKSTGLFSKKELVKENMAPSQT